MGKKKSKGDRNERSLTSLPNDDAKLDSQNVHKKDRSRSEPPSGAVEPSKSSEIHYPQLPEESPEAEDLAMNDVENDNATLETEMKQLRPQGFHQKVYKKEAVAKTLRKWYLAEPGPETEKLEKELLKVNQKLEKLNEKNSFDRDVGTIPLTTFYAPHKDLTKPLLKRLKTDDKDLEAVKSWNSIRDIVSQGNHQRGYDKSWDFPRDYIQKRIGLDVSDFKDSSGASSQAKDKKTKQLPIDKQSKSQQRLTERQRSKQPQGKEDEGDESSDNRSDNNSTEISGVDSSDNDSNESSDNDSSNSSDNDSSDSSDVDTDIDDSLDGLAKALERNHPGMLLSGTVEGYRKCGSGYQCLVRYGSEDSPTFRLVPGASVGDWDLDNLPSLVKKQRGNLQKENGKWRYNKADVFRLAHVAWKPYQEIGEEPLDSLHPELLGLQGSAAGTYVRVVWGDKVQTWETRTTIRRLIGRDQQKADWMIYDRAIAQEKRYRKGKGQKGASGTSSATMARSSVQSEIARRASSARTSRSDRGSARLKTPRNLGAEPRSNSMELFEDVRDSIEQSPAWRAASRGLSMPLEQSYNPKARRSRKQSELRFDPKLGERYDQGVDVDYRYEDMIKVRDIVLGEVAKRLRQGNMGSSRPGRASRSVGFAGVD